MDYDVIVVGAGPGGLVCGRRCAELGLKTLIIDKKQEIGIPVRCGEGLSEYWVKNSGIDPDASWCLREIHGAVVFSPLGKEIVLNTERKGFILERRVFEKKLAHKAIECGVKIMLKTLVTDVIKENGLVKGVVIEDTDGTRSITSNIVIAADGVDSKVARFAGVQTVNPLAEVDSGYQYEMAGLKINHTDKIHLYFGKEVAPRGYVWIFPKSDTIANVGIGIGGSHKEHNAKHYLDKFIDAHPEIFKNASIVQINGGCIPVGAPIKKPYTNGMMIIGDAAHMVNPIHGGGIGTTMEAGIIAAEVAKKSIDANDFSEKFLSKFGDEWYEKRGNDLLKVLRVRKFFEQLNDADLEKLAEVLTPEVLLDFIGGKKTTGFLKLVSKFPKIALIAAKTFI